MLPIHLVCLSGYFHGYQRKVLDSGLRRNDGLGGVYPLIHSLRAELARVSPIQLNSLHSAGNQRLIRRPRRAHLRFLFQFHGYPTYLP
jgi:hypothetical protein